MRQELFQPSRHTMLWSALSTLAWTVVVMALFRSSIGQDINYRVATTVEFRTRESLGQSPKLSKRIKIFGFDDKTLGHLKRSELYIEEWAQAIRRLAVDKPKVVVIDKMFSVIYDPNNKIDEALNVLKSLEVNVVVGSFFTPDPISYRQNLRVDKNLYNLDFISQNGISVESRAKKLYMQQPNSLSKVSTFPGPRSYGFQDFRHQFIYGPTIEFQEAFTFVGHLQYSGHTKAAPYIRVSNEAAVPHASLLAANSLKIIDGQLKVNDFTVPLDSQGNVVVNLAHPQTYYVGQKRLSILLDAHKKEPLVEEGDIVLLLLNMFTGGTDFHLTPFGYAPGGFILAAMINSAITGSWLNQLSLPLTVIALGCLLGGILGAFSGSLTFWLLLAIGCFAVVILGIVTFSYFGLIIPWLWIALGFLGNGMIVFAQKIRFTEKRIQSLQLVEAERKLLAKELLDASVIAEAYRPDTLPEWSQLLIGGYHNPIRAASGDWFAFEASQSGRLYHMIMCDITGHGVQAALVVSACKTLLGNIKSLRPELVEEPNFMSHYMRLLNGILWMQGGGQHVTTLLGLTFALDNHLVYYLAAGHPYPLLRKNEQMGEKPISLISRHNPLGLSNDCLPMVREIAFRPGDEILAFTDGVPLLENRRILKKMMPRDWQNIRKGPKELYDRVWHLEAKKSGKYPEDDVSIIWFKFV